MACRLVGAKPYLNRCWNIVNWTLGNKLQWNYNRNSNIFIEENAFENVVCEMMFISSRPQCVKVKSKSKYKRFTESQKTMYAGLPTVTEFQYFVKEMRPWVKKFFWILAQNTEIFCYFSMIIAWKYWNSGKCYWKSWNYSKWLLK